MKRKNIALAAFMLVMPLILGAQTLKGSYFLDNSINRHRMNPAFAPNSGFVNGPSKYSPRTVLALGIAALVAAIASIVCEAT